MKMTKAFGYIIAANFEAVALLVGAWLVGDWLNENVAQNFSWMPITFGAAIVVLVHSWYVIFKTLMRMDREQRLNKKEERP